MREDLLDDILSAGHRVYALEDLDADATAAADALVSIGDPDFPVPRHVLHAQKRFLALNFYDYDDEDPEAPQESHIRALLDFAAQTKPDEKLLVHCYAGISRSTAALAIILAVLHPEIDYDTLFEAVRRIRPEAWPNGRMVECADGLMQCNGRFSAALSRFRERITRTMEAP